MHLLHLERRWLSHHLGHVDGQPPRGRSGRPVHRPPRSRHRRRGGRSGQGRPDHRRPPPGHHLRVHRRSRPLPRTAAVRQRTGVWRNGCGRGRAGGRHPRRPAHPADRHRRRLSDPAGMDRRHRPRVGAVGLPRLPERHPGRFRRLRRRLLPRSRHHPRCLLRLRGVGGEPAVRGERPGRARGGHHLHRRPHQRRLVGPRR